MSEPLPQSSRKLLNQATVVAVVFVSWGTCHFPRTSRVQKAEPGDRQFFHDQIGAIETKQLYWLPQKFPSSLLVCLQWQQTCTHTEQTRQKITTAFFNQKLFSCFDRDLHYFSPCVSGVALLEIIGTRLRVDNYYQRKLRILKFQISVSAHLCQMPKPVLSRSSIILPLDNQDKTCE